MISRSYRIQTKEFPGVTRGKIHMDEHIRISVKKEETLNNPKCAVIISHKIAKKAIIRNRIRRKIYAWIRENSTRLPLAYICIYPKSSETPTEVLYHSLNKLLCGK